MSTRIISLSLQVGRAYLNRDGRTIILYPRRSSNPDYPYQGEGKIYTESGAYRLGAVSTEDLILPVYQVGIKYKNGKGDVVQITRISEDFIYARDVSGSCTEECHWNRDGSSPYDDDYSLQDYAPTTEPKKPAMVDHPPSPVRAEGMSLCDLSKIGKRLRFDHLRVDRPGTGMVFSINKERTHYQVLLDTKDGHDAIEGIPSGFGWYVAYDDSSIEWLDSPDQEPPPLHVFEQQAVFPPCVSQSLFTHADRLAIWDAYISLLRGGVSISIRGLIDDRRNLLLS